jgi:hypothetical protein
MVVLVIVGGVVLVSTRKGSKTKLERLKHRASDAKWAKVMCNESVITERRC